MNASELPGLFGQRPSAIVLRQALKEVSPQKIKLEKNAGSSTALTVAAVHHESPCTVIILNDKEEAAYFQNDLENILGENKAYLFPGSYKKSFSLDDLDSNAIQQRAEVLDRLHRHKQIIITTYPEAISEKVVTHSNLEKNSVEIRTGENLGTEFITEFLLHHEFEHTDFVVQAGEFAVRGGIIDIFSFANDLPYRIELFGDKVESIRTFDPETQLSVTYMNHVSILPNVQTSLLRQERTSFLQFIPASSSVWIKDIVDLMTIVDSGIEKAVSSSNHKNVDEDIRDLFDNGEQLKNFISNKTCIETGNRFFFQHDLTVDMNCHPQPSFNKNFNLLLENIQSNYNNKYETIICCDSVKQLERLHAIIDDAGKNFSGSTIPFSEKWKGIVVSLHEGFIDHQSKQCIYTDHQIFDRYHRFKLKKNYSRSESITIKELQGLKPGDFITHIDHGVGRFAGLEMIDVNGKPQEAVRLVYKDNDILYVSIHSLHRIAKYSGKDGTIPALHKLGSQAWSVLKQKTKKRVKDIAKDLIALYAKRRSAKGFAFAPDNYLQNELEASFIYEDTPDQNKATRDVKGDMEKGYPMDRLVCGDVGFGKTEVAIRAAFKAVNDSKQVAVLVPTTILALQHYKTFGDRLKDFPCKVDYINRFKSAAKQKETLQQLADGKIDILIGTHKLLGKEIKFKDLGLMIIDEEQKFGVAAKEKLKALRVNVDTLTLTATPIPRTLQFSLMGARDLSIINTPPPNRFPVSTQLHVFNDTLIKEAIEYEVSRNGQVFFIHNRVSDIHDMGAMIEKLCPGVKVAIGHGQMDGEKLEAIMLGFIEGEYDVLVSTTIIESGLDIPNANTIIIHQAQNFGLSDLHQMRGRVGRSNKKAFCYLLTPPMTVLTNEARQRLKAIEEFSDLGSGFNVAMRDLDIRGAGNLLGGEQSGFVSEIGFEMYHKILDEAIHELKETEFSEVFAEEIRNKPFVYDCQIETDLEIRLPHSYVNSVTERLSLYKELDAIKEKTKLDLFETSLIDRFGALPLPAQELLATIELRWMAEKCGFEKLVLKNQKMIGHFVNNQQSHFYQSEIFSVILKFVQKHEHLCRLREEKNKLTLSVKNIMTVNDALLFLQKLTN